MDGSVACLPTPDETVVNMKYITKMDYPRNKGYWVRFYKDKELISKRSFALGVYGSWEAALDAAVVWRDNELDTNPDLKHLRVDGLSCLLYFKRTPKNNTSGRVGVHRAIDVSHGREVEVWVCTFCLDHRPKTVKFYIESLGEETAKRLAHEARELIEWFFDNEDINIIRQVLTRPTTFLRTIKFHKDRGVKWPEKDFSSYMRSLTIWWMRSRTSPRQLLEKCIQA